MAIIMVVLKNGSFFLALGAAEAVEEGTEETFGEAVEDGDSVVEASILGVVAAQPSFCAQS